MTRDRGRARRRLPLTTAGPGLVDLAAVAAEAASCTNCDLYRNATQTVFGEGPAPAELMLVGEQPGDREDRAGRPFVGPADLHHAAAATPAP